MKIKFDKTRLLKVVMGILFIAYIAALFKGKCQIRKWIESVQKM